MDSDYHNLDADKLRDEYLEQLGIEVFRIYNLEKITTQKGKFKEFIALLKSKVPVQNPRPFDFLGDLRKENREEIVQGYGKSIKRFLVPSRILLLIVYNKIETLLN